MKLSIFAVSLLSVISFNNQALAADPIAVPSIDVVQRYSAPPIPAGSTEIFNQKLDINPLSAVQRQAFERLSQSLKPNTELVLTVVPSTTVKEGLAIARQEAAIKEADAQIAKLKKELDLVQGNSEKAAQVQAAIAAEEQKRLKAQSLKEESLKGALVKEEAKQLVLAQHKEAVKATEVRINEINLELAKAKVELDVAEAKKNKNVNLMELKKKIADLELKIGQEGSLKVMQENTVKSLEKGTDPGLMHLRIAVESPEAAAKVFEKYSTGANRILAVHKVPVKQAAKNLGKGLVPAAVIGAAAAATAIAERNAANPSFKLKIQSAPPASSSGAQ